MNKVEILNNLAIAMPEIAIAVLGVLSLLILSISSNSKRLIINLQILYLFAIMYFVNMDAKAIMGEAFSGSFVVNNYVLLFKNLILLGTILILFGYSSSHKKISVEYAVLILFSVIGGMVALSSRDLLVLFMALELQSLPAYILAAFSRDNARSSEAGLKYFILGSISTAIMLFGSSLTYGFTGTLHYDSISHSLLSNSSNIALIVGISMIVISFLFKLSIAPFHVWTPDVYEGAPTYSVIVFSSLHKISIIGVMVAFLGIILQRYTLSFVPIIKILAILSLLIGSFGGVIQTSIKRLLGYSTIFNLGFVLLAVMTDLNVGIYRPSFLTYIVIYALSTIGLLCILYELYGDRLDNLKIKELGGMSKHAKYYALTSSMILVSMLGLPPMAGFFIKYDVLFELIALGDYLTASVALVTSVVSAYYYLNIIKSIYFDEDFKILSGVKLNIGVWLISVTIAGVLLLFSIFLADYFNGLQVKL